MAIDSLEQTLLKLRERIAFLERANQKLGEDHRRVIAQFAEIEALIGGCGGLTLAGAVAARLGKQERKFAKQQLAWSGRRANDHARLEQYGFARDTGAISDDVIDSL